MKVAKIDASFKESLFSSYLKDFVFALKPVFCSAKVWFANFAAALVVIFSTLSYLLPREIGSVMLFILSALLILRLFNKVKLCIASSLLAAFAAVCILSGFLNPLQSIHSFNSTIQFVLSVNCFFLFLAIKKWEKFFLSLTLFISSLHVFFTLAQFFFPEFFSHVVFANLPTHIKMASESTRFKGLMGITNQSAVNAFFITLCISCISSYLLCVNKCAKNSFPRIKKILYSLFLGCAYIALFLTFKRAHILGNLLASLCLLVFVSEKHGRLIRNFMIAIGFVLLIGVLFYFSYPEINVFWSRFYIGGSNFLSSRNILWNYALTLTSRFPITGCGFTRFGQYLIRDNVLNIAHDPHNIYLQLLCETGPIGLLLFICFSILCLYQTCRKLKSVYKVYGGARMTYIGWSFYFQIFFLLYGLTGNPLTDSNINVIYFVAVSIAFKPYV